MKRMTLQELVTYDSTKPITDADEIESLVDAFAELSVTRVYKETLKMNKIPILTHLMKELAAAGVLKPGAASPGSVKTGAAGTGAAGTSVGVTKAGMSLDALKAGKAVTTGNLDEIAASLSFGELTVLAEKALVGSLRRRNWKRYDDLLYYLAVMYMQSPPNPRGADLLRHLFLMIDTESYLKWAAKKNYEAGYPDYEYRLTNALKDSAVRPGSKSDSSDEKHTIKDALQKATYTFAEYGSDEYYESCDRGNLRDPEVESACQIVNALMIDAFAYRRKG